MVAIDIQPEMIAHLEQREKELGLANVEAHLGAVDDLKMPAESLDAALLVDAYHEFSHPREMMQSLVKALRPGGRVYLLEYRAEDPKVPIKPLHKMTEAQAILEMQAVGLELVASHDFLPMAAFPGVCEAEVDQRQGPISERSAEAVDVRNEPSIETFPVVQSALLLQHGLIRTARRSVPASPPHNLAFSPHPFFGLGLRAPLPKLPP